MAVSTIPVRAGTPSSDTSAHPAPRVRLPDMRRPITPAPNSWADSEKLEKVTAKSAHELQPTNRDRYENKPLPKISTSTSQHVDVQQRRPIQPAIPLINTLSFPKTRAVTDPIQHRALLSTRKPSVSQLKKRGKTFELSTSKIDLLNEPNLPSSNVPPKALQILGVRQEEAFGQQTPNIRAQTPDQVQRISDGLESEDLISRRHSPNSRQANLSTAISCTPSNEQDSPHQLPVLEVKSSDAARTCPVPQEINTTSLQPPSTAATGNEGKQFGVVHQKILHPSKSFQAIIETASPTSTEEHGASKLEQHITPTKHLKYEPSGEVLRPTVYSPNSYKGVWEFDPAVGHTLPPFSPMPKMGQPDHQHVPEKLMAVSNNGFQNTYQERFPRNPSAMYGDQHQDPQDGTMRVVSQMASEGLSNEPRRTDSLQYSKDPTKTDKQWQWNRAIPPRNASKSNDARSHPHNSIEHGQHGLQKAILDSRTQSFFNPPHTPSNNSWATTSTPTPPPPQWPVLQLHNPVPSPPYSQQDYRRPSPLSAGLAQLDMTLHHHIDSIFHSLSRQHTDQHDRVLDRVLIRIDNLEEKVCKDIKGIKLEMSSMRKELEKLRTSPAYKPHDYNTVIDALQTLDGKIDALEGHVDQIKCKGHIQFADLSSIEANVQGHRHNPPYHHSRSAHGSIDGSLSSRDRQYRSQIRNGAGAVASSRSPSKSRHSGNSNGSELKGARSRAASASGWQAGEARLDIGRATGREEVRGPDLRNHPAYQQQKETGQMDKSLGLEGETLSRQALVEEGWYQQAYGRRS